MTRASAAAAPAALRRRPRRAPPQAPEGETGEEDEQAPAKPPTLGDMEDSAMEEWRPMALQKHQVPLAQVRGWGARAPAAAAVASRRLGPPAPRRRAPQPPAPAALRPRAAQAVRRHLERLAPEALDLAGLLRRGPTLRVSRRLCRGADLELLQAGLQALAPGAGEGAGKNGEPRAPRALGRPLRCAAPVPPVQCRRAPAPSWPRERAAGCCRARRAAPHGGPQARTRPDCPALPWRPAAPCTCAGPAMETALLDALGVLKVCAAPESFDAEAARAALYDVQSCAEWLACRLPA